MDKWEIDNLQDLYQDQSKPEQPSALSPEKARLIAAGLEKLQSYGLLNNHEAVRDWANGLADLDEGRLLEGFRKAKDYSGYMSLGDFRKLCARSNFNASHKPFKALPRGDVLPPEEAHKRAKEILKMLGEDV